MFGDIFEMHSKFLSQEMESVAATCGVLVQYIVPFCLYHSALGRSPFEVLYGHPPRHFGITNLQMCSTLELEAWLKERELLSRLIHQQLLRAQQRMKHQADKHRSEHIFSVGDLVYLKLQSYIQTSIAARGNQKLAFRFFGPFKILQRIGKVAYKLDLPSDAKIHPVVHVS